MSSIRLSLAVSATLLLSACELIGDIFKAGVWTGVVIVVAVIAAVIYGVMKLFR